MSFSEILRKINNHIGTHKVHLCPEVKGRLVNNGAPLANVRILRTLSYSDGKYTKDECFTDSNGEFEMPEMSLRSSQPALLIAEKIRWQEITAQYSGDNFILWSSNPSGISVIQEYVDKLNSLNGDIINEEVFFSFKGTSGQNSYCAKSICRWDDDFVLIDLEADFDRMISGIL